jgi:hypothetical protein
MSATSTLTALTREDRDAFIERVVRTVTRCCTHPSRRSK